MSDNDPHGSLQKVGLIAAYNHGGMGAIFGIAKHPAVLEQRFIPDTQTLVDFCLILSYQLF